MRLVRALALAFLLGLALAQVEIPLWHTLGEGGFLEAEAEAFNRFQGRFRILPRFVGDYRELGVLLATALRNGTAPPVAQVELGFLPVLAQEGLAAPLPLLEEALEKALKGNVPPRRALEEAQARASRMP